MKSFPSLLLVILVFLGFRSVAQVPVRYEEHNKKLTKKLLHEKSLFLVIHDNRYPVEIKNDTLYLTKGVVWDSLITNPTEELVIQVVGDKNCFYMLIGNFFKFKRPEIMLAIQKVKLRISILGVVKIPWFSNEYCSVVYDGYYNRFSALIPCEEYQGENMQLNWK